MACAICNKEIPVWSTGYNVKGATVCKDCFASGEADELRQSISSKSTGDSDGSTITAAHGNQGNAVLNRYRDAYQVSASIIGYGTTLKAVGGILGILFALIGLIVDSATESILFAAGGLLLGIVVGLPIYQLGLLTTAQGQLLLATLDTAVNTSPLLDNNERRLAMGLPSENA